MGDPENPKLKEFHINGTEFEEYAEDVPPGGLQGLLTTQEGFPDVTAEFVGAHAKYGAAAGIPDGDIGELAKANERIARIDVFLPVYLKAAEMLTETRALLDDKRQRIILNGANSVDRRAGKNSALLAAYEQTRTYRSSSAKKGVKTRAKNAQQAEGTDEPVAPPGAPDKPTPT